MICAADFRDNLIESKQFAEKSSKELSSILQILTKKIFLIVFKCLLVCLATVLSNVKVSSAQGNNLYLPPKEPGYDYPKPGPGPAPGPKPGPAPGPRPQPSKPQTDEVS
jgi:hypothetical protein